MLYVGIITCERKVTYNAMMFGLMIMMNTLFVTVKIIRMKQLMHCLTRSGDQKCKKKQKGNKDPFRTIHPAKVDLIRFKTM
jgi:hypothetical protein